MRQRHQRVAADNELESKKTRAAKFAKKVARLAHMHKPGLHPSLEPACALTKPCTDPGGRLFIGRVINHTRSVTEAGEPHTEIGVLRDIVRIPAADFAQRRCAEMVRRPAER